MTARLRSLARFAAPGFCFFWAVACGQSSASVATVNGQSISRAELDRQTRVYLSVRPGLADDVSTRQQVLDQLIKQRLLAQAARAAGLDQDPGRQQQIQQRRESLRAELERSIADQQAQLAALDDAVETKALIDAYSQAKRGGITVTAKDLQAAYDLRARREPLPPLGQIRDQLLEQVILDRLVEDVRKKASVSVDAQALR
jgi:peptidyl-prolyl cis-trans isomerase C